MNLQKSLKWLEIATEGQKRFQHHFRQVIYFLFVLFNSRSLYGFPVMKPVYKHLSGHVVGARPNLNGPIREKMTGGFVSRVTVRCLSAYHKPCRKTEELKFTQNFSVS